MEESCLVESLDFQLSGESNTKLDTLTDISAKTPLNGSKQM